MDEDKYFEISKKEGLTNRCPILDICERRAMTIYLFNDYSKVYPNKSIFEALYSEGDLKEHYLKEEIKICGELPAIAIGNKRGHFLNTCPEVNLFDSENAFGTFYGTACTEAAWDDEEKEESKKIKIFKEKHYSKCSEFSKYMDKKNNPK